MEAVSRIITKIKSGDLCIKCYKIEHALEVAGILNAIQLPCELDASDWRGGPYYLYYAPKIPQTLHFSKQVYPGDKSIDWTTLIWRVKDRLSKKEEQVVVS